MVTYHPNESFSMWWLDKSLWSKESFLLYHVFDLNWHKSRVSEWSWEPAYSSDVIIPAGGFDEKILCMPKRSNYRRLRVARQKYFTKVYMGRAIVKKPMHMSSFKSSRHRVHICKHYPSLLWFRFVIVRSDYIMVFSLIPQKGIASRI